MWFADDKMRDKDLQYRFPGKESRLFSHNFRTIIDRLKTDADQTCHTCKLHVFAYRAMNLRDSVSLFIRVTLSSDQVESLGQLCSNFFRATALFLSCTSTSWTIGPVVTVHAKQIQETLGMGLGINTIKGREAKHISLANFTKKTLSLTTDGVRILGAMKLSTNTLQMFIYPRGVSVISFAIVVYPKMLMLSNVIFVLTISTS